MRAQKKRGRRIAHDVSYVSLLFIGMDWRDQKLRVRLICLLFPESFEGHQIGANDSAKNLRLIFKAQPFFRRHFENISRQCSIVLYQPRALRQLNSQKMHSRVLYCLG